MNNWHPLLETTWLEWTGGGESGHLLNEERTRGRAMGSLTNTHQRVGRARHPTVSPGPRPSKIGVFLEYLL